MNEKRDTKNRTFNFPNLMLNEINKFNNRSELIRKALNWFIEIEENREVDGKKFNQSGTITADIGMELNNRIERLCNNNGISKRFLSVSGLTRHAIREYLLYSNAEWIEEQLNPKKPEIKEKIDPVDKFLKENNYVILRNA